MVYTLTVHLYANDKPESIPRLKAKLIEASRIYSKDKETIEWLVMQDVHDPRAFTIVERFENEAVCRLPSPNSSRILFTSREPWGGFKANTVALTLANSEL